MGASAGHTGSGLSTGPSIGQLRCNKTKLSKTKLDVKFQWTLAPFRAGGGSAWRLQLNAKLKDGWWGVTENASARLQA